jgi:hypothetical protein
MAELGSARVLLWLWARGEMMVVLGLGREAVRAQRVAI